MAFQLKKINLAQMTLSFLWAFYLLECDSAPDGCPHSDRSDEANFVQAIVDSHLHACPEERREKKRKEEKRREEAERTSGISNLSKRVYI